VGKSDAHTETKVKSMSGTTGTAALGKHPSSSVPSVPTRSASASAGTAMPTDFRRPGPVHVQHPSAQYSSPYAREPPRQMPTTSEKDAAILDDVPDLLPSDDDDIPLPRQSSSSAVQHAMKKVMTDFDSDDDAPPSSSLMDRTGSKSTGSLSSDRQTGTLTALQLGKIAAQDRKVRFYFFVFSQLNLTLLTLDVYWWC